MMRPFDFSVEATGVAEAEGISARAVRAAFRRTMMDPKYKWRGARLYVYALFKPGGRQPLYVVRVSSLPEDVRERVIEEAIRP